MSNFTYITSNSTAKSNNPASCGRYNRCGSKPASPTTAPAISPPAPPSPNPPPPPPPSPPPPPLPYRKAAPPVMQPKDRVQPPDTSPNYGSSDYYGSLAPQPTNTVSGGDGAFYPRSSVSFTIPVAGLVVGIIAVVFFVLLLVYCLKRKGLLAKAKFFRKNKKHENIKAFLRSHNLHALRQYTYGEIKKVANSFKDKLGEGGFGGVFKGTLPDGRLVAVKVLTDSKSNGEDFINEVSSISRTSHVNIVSLLGFCYKPKRVLIYEYMPNGSLDKLIYNQGSFSANRRLEWKTLYEISIGIARGLEYLHRGCNTRILHFDIKPHNILLDENFCAKISDFGLAKLSKKDQSSVSVVGARGTTGYIAPEVCSNHFGRVSYKSDVYSYGMMVLEMVGRRRNIDPNVSEISKIYFPHYIFRHIEASSNLKLEGVNNKEEEEMARKMIIVSLWCIQTNPSDRPSMTGVLEMLEGRIQSLPFPPNPFASSPTSSP